MVSSPSSFILPCSPFFRYRWSSFTGTLYDVVLKTMNGTFKSRQNIDDCKEEALEIVKKDFILEKYNNPVRITLLRILSSKIEGKNRNDNLDDKSTPQYYTLNRMYYQLKRPIIELKNHYLTYILDELFVQIDNNDDHMVEKCISTLISQCLAHDWSAKGLFRIVDCFLGADKTEDEKKNEFKSVLLQQRECEYSVFFQIKFNTDVTTAEQARGVIQSMQLDLLHGSNIIKDSNTNQALASSIKSESIYIKVLQSATDPYAAALKVINRLNSKLSVATFYNTVNPWIAQRPHIVIQSLTDGSVLSITQNEVFRTYDYIDSNNSIFADTHQIFTSSNPNTIAIAAKLSPAFSYTNLSRTSLYQETKFIALWIALESVMHTGQYADIISHIKTILPEILCIRYFYRYVRNFSDDCCRCSLKEITDLGLSFNTGDKKETVKRLVQVFRNPTEYSTLLSLCERNRLLKYRCNEIHSVLNDIELIRERLEHFNKKVKWHIQRLYRIRNEITHSAFQENKSLVIYIEHLYSYLAQLISEVVYYIEHKGCESVEEAYATISECYKTYMEIICNDNLDVQKVLQTGIIEL